MVLYFRALASGSSGNAYLLRTGKTALLFDAGLRGPVLRRHLETEGVRFNHVDAILLSHEHRDHCAGALKLVNGWNVPVWANPEVLQATDLADHPSAAVVAPGVWTLFGDVEVMTFPVEHDAVAPVGFLVRTQGRTITIATDLGRPTTAVIEAVAAADLVVLEANHDEDMLHGGRYPRHLRARVSGPRGHLSNTQAAATLAGSVRNGDTEVWLAHLSRENNTMSLAVRTVRRALQAAGLGAVRVDVAGRDRPSLCWRGQSRPRQPSLFDSLATP